MFFLFFFFLNSHLDSFNAYNITISQNIFSGNNVSLYGSCIFISNFQSLPYIIINSSKFNDNKVIQSNSNNFNGPVVYLLNPASILIKNCYFFKNVGFGGTCIYYSEIRNGSLMILKNNTFEKNIAQFGAAGIYFYNKYDKIMPDKDNHFIENNGIDFETAPFRFELKYSTFNSSKFNKIYKVNIIPGFPILNLSVYLLDYYGNKISYFNGSVVWLEILSKNFSNIEGISFQGVNTSQISKGNIFNLR